MENENIFVLVAHSAIHMGMLLLGAGRTRADAIANAYGPRGARRPMRGHYVREMPLAEAIDLWDEERIYYDLD